MNTDVIYFLIIRIGINNEINIADPIVCFRKGDSGEQITGDSIEQWNIMGEELGLINILYGP